MKNKIITLLLIGSIQFANAQKDIFEKMPFSLGDKLSYDALNRKIDRFKSNELSISRIGQTDTQIISGIRFNIYSKKDLETVEAYYKYQKGTKKISRVTWGSSYTDCYVNEQEDLEIIIKYEPYQDPIYVASLDIKSYQLQTEDLFKYIDNKNRTITYLTERYSYLEIDQDNCINLNYRFGHEDPSAIYAMVDLRSFELHKIKSIQYILDNGTENTKDLTLLSQERLSNAFLVESAYTLLNHEDLIRMNESQEIEVILIGEETKLKFLMTYPQKAAISDILNSAYYKNLYDTKVKI